MKHTPGPWTIETPMGEEEPWIVQAGKQSYEWQPIAVIPCEGGDDELPISEANANARLIVAAPELLAALKQLWESSRCEPVGKDGKDCWLVSPQALNNARDIISKVDGRNYPE